MSNESTMAVDAQQSETTTTDIYSMDFYFNANVKLMSLSGIIKDLLEYTGQTVPIEHDMLLCELKDGIKARLAKARMEQEGVPDRIRSRLVLLHMLFPQKVRFTFVSDQPPVAADNDVHEVDATAEME